MSKNKKKLPVQAEKEVQKEAMEEAVEVSMKSAAPPNDLFALRYLNPNAAREEVLNTLASLELDIHKMGIQATLQGGDGSLKLKNGLTIDEAVAATRVRISRIEHAYRHIIFPDAK